MSTADICAKTTELPLVKLSHVLGFNSHDVWRPRSAALFVKKDQTRRRIRHPLSLSPSVVARGRRDRAHACCSDLLLEPPCEFSASLDPSSELQIFVGVRCTFCRGKDLSGWNVERGVYKEIFIYRDWSAREREKKRSHQ